MDEDLEALLSNPFETGTMRPTSADDAQAAVRALQEHAGDVTSRTVHDFSHFRGEIDVILRPHISTARVIEEKLLSDTVGSRVREVVQPHATKFRACLDNLRKIYRTYVETASDSTLEREALRLERRYFQSKANDAQLEFIKMKRFYEKIKTFNESARRDWRDIQKFIDTLGIMQETRTIVQQVEEQYVKSVGVLIRQTDSFLDALKIYIKVEEETLDQITGGYRIVVAYDPNVRYNFGGFFGDPEPMSDERPALRPAPEEAVDETTQSSIATSIVIESREHKLNRASVFSANLLGSRDWNRTPDYSLEVPVAYYDETMELFKNSYHVNIDPENIRGPMSSAAALVRAGEGRNILNKYVTMIHGTLDWIEKQITEKDFPGLEKPLVFVYHVGPQAMDRMLINTLHRSKIGEMFYLDAQSNTVTELPEEIVRKELIEWWNRVMGELNLEDVDSYLTYSRALEMVKKEYRALYEEGTKMFKREQPGASYFGLEKWITQNRTRIFGMRKMEVFKRFLTGTVLNQF